MLQINAMSVLSKAFLPLIEVQQAISYHMASSADRVPLEFNMLFEMSWIGLHDAVADLAHLLNIPHQMSVKTRINMVVLTLKMF
jgi:hypothetical protein